MLFQKEKDYGNTITKIGRKKNKKNETAKNEKKIKRKEMHLLKQNPGFLDGQKNLKFILNTSSEKVSFCALNKKASLALENSTCASYDFCWEW